MDNEPLIALSKKLIILVVIVLGLLAYIVYEKTKTPDNDKAQIIDYVVDSTNILIENKQSYRNAANQIHADFEPENGQKIFKENCMMCHSLHEKIIGPRLFDVFNRIPNQSPQWMFAYISNTDSLIAAGDKYADNLRREYNTIKWNHRDTMFSKSGVNDLVGFLAMMR